MDHLEERNAAGEAQTLEKGNQASTSTLSYKVFKKRLGTTDVGKDYENLFMANLVLNFIEDDTIQNFNLWSNDSKFGDFDDIILETESNVCEKTTKCAFQLKHVTKVKQFSVESLKREKGNFSITRYFQSFQYYKLLSNYDIILLTNLKFTLREYIEFQLPVETERIRVKMVEVEVNPLVNTNKANRHCYKFEIIPEHHNQNVSSILQDYEMFFKRFYFYTNQLSFETLRNNIPNQLQSRFSCQSEVLDKYLKFFSEWNLVEGFKNTLHKTMMKELIALYLLSANMHPVSFGKITENRKILQTAISKFPVSVFDKTSIQGGPNIWVVCEDDIDITEANIANTNFQITTNWINKISDLNDENCSKLLWLMNKCPLIVEKCPGLDKALQLCTHKTFIVLNNTDKRNLKNYQVFYKLTDLKREDQIFNDILSDFKCSLHQREITLRELVKNTNLSDTITTNDLLLMVDENYKFKQRQEDLESYIPRQLSRRVIKLESLDNILNGSLILISNIGSKQNLLLRKKYKVVDVLEFLSTENGFHQNVVVVSEENCPFQAICNRNKTRKTVHHFRSFGKDLEWIQSVGDIMGLPRCCISDGFLEEDELVSINNQTNIHLIVGDPGMGKSWLLKRLKNKFSPSVVTTIFTPEDVTNICTFLNRNDNFNELGDYILKLKHSECNNLDQCVITSLTNKQQVLYLWDAFDEIENQNKIIKVIKSFSEKGIVQWITTRIFFKNTLESEFCVLSRTLYGFNEVQQKEYIQKLPVVDNAYFFKYKDILSIPLQIRLFTEFCKQGGVFSLLNLYEFFVNEKLNFYFHKKKVNLNLIKEHNKLLIQRLENAALLTIFEKDILKRLQLDLNKMKEDVKTLKDPIGFVIEENQLESEAVTFAHMSYAEFFAACFLARDKSGACKEFIFDEKYKNVRYFFDLMLAKNCPSHTAVLCNNISKLEDRINSEDAGGRNPLHLACSWGPRWTTLLFEKKRNIFYLTSTNLPPFENPLEYLKLIELLLDCNINKPDDIFNMTSIEYAEKTDSFWALAAIAEKHNTRYFNGKNDNIKCTLLYLAVKFNLSQFITLFKDFVNQVKTNDLDTLLHLVCENGNKKTLQMLLEAGVETKVYNKEKVTPLMNACRNGNEEVVEMLINTGVDVNASCKQGVTALMHACCNGNVKVVEMLLKTVNVNASDKKGVTALMYACENGHEALVEMLIASGVEVGLSDKNGTTSLMYACTNGNEKVVAMITKAGVDVQASDKKGVTPLMCACQNGNETLVEMILNTGVDINASDKNNVTPLMYACENANKKVVEMLIKKDVDTNASDKTGCTPLMYACKTKNVDVVEMLIKTGAKINTSNKEGDTPLMYASTKGDTKIVKTLIKHGVDINAVDDAGDTPLIRACTEGKEKVVEVLIQLEVDINASNKKGDTPLIRACENSHEKVVEVLIKAGVDVNAFNKEDITPVLCVCKTGNSKILKQLIKAGINIDAPNQQGITPLMCACRNNNKKIVELLIKSGVDVNYSNEEGDSALTFACLNDDVMKLLNDANVNVNASDQNGYTPLMKACENGNEQQVEKLIKIGVDVNASDDEGVTPLMYACKNAREKVVAMLINVKADFNASDKNGINSFMYACKANNEKVVDMLIQAGVDINASDKQDATSLMLACESGHEKVVEMLIKAGVDINASNGRGLTPLMCACRNGKEKVVKMLIEEEADFDHSDVEDLTALMYAYENDYDNIMLMLIQAGVDVDATNKAGLTLLMRACSDGNEKIVKILINVNADCNASDKNGVTALMYACQNGNEKIVEMLLNTEVEINASDKNGITALIYACTNSNEKIVEMLIKNKADVDLEDQPLTYAYENNLEGIMKMLIDTGVDVDAPNHEGLTLFMRACSDGDEAFSKMLIEAGVDINASDNKGVTPLMYACENNHEKIVEMLIKAKVDINASNKDGVTPFIRACWYGNEKVVEMLMKAGVEINVANKEGVTPLIAACTKGYVKIVKMLLNTEVNINASDKNFSTSLMCACDNNHEEIVEMLINSPEVDINASDKYGTTSLMFACRNGNEKIVEMLINVGVNINAFDHKRVTALMYACLKGHEKVVEMLIKAKVDINASNEDVNPLMYACQCSNEKIVELLLNAGIDVHTSDIGVLPLLYACIKGDEKIVDMLIKARVNINGSNSEGDTPLIYACENSHEKVVEMLIKAGVDVHASNQNGLTPSMIAESKGNQRILEMLNNPSY